MCAMMGLGGSSNHGPALILLMTKYLIFSDAGQRRAILELPNLTLFRREGQGCPECCRLGPQKRLLPTRVDTLHSISCLLGPLTPDCYGRGSGIARVCSVCYFYGVSCFASRKMPRCLLSSSGPLYLSCVSAVHALLLSPSGY